MLRQITAIEIDGQGGKVQKPIEMRTQDQRNWFTWTLTKNAERLLKTAAVTFS